MQLRVNEQGLPLQIELSPGQAHDAPMAGLLLQDLPRGTSLLADRGYDADASLSAARSTAFRLQWQADCMSGLCGDPC